MCIDTCTLHTHIDVFVYIHTERKRETYKLLTAAYSCNSFCLMALLGFLIVMTNWLPSNAEMGKASWSYRRNMRTYLTMCKGTQGLFYFFFIFFSYGENRKGGLNWNNVNHLAIFFSRSHSLWMLCKASSWVDCCQFRGISEKYCHALSETNGRFQSCSQHPSRPYLNAHCNIWHKSMPQKMLSDGGLISSPISTTVMGRNVPSLGKFSWSSCTCSETATTNTSKSPSLSSAVLTSVPLKQCGSHSFANGCDFISSLMLPGIFLQSPGLVRLWLWSAGQKLSLAISAIWVTHFPCPVLPHRISLSWAELWPRQEIGDLPAMAMPEGVPRGQDSSCRSRSSNSLLTGQERWNPSHAALPHILSNRGENVRNVSEIDSEVGRVSIYPLM